MNGFNFDHRPALITTNDRCKTELLPVPRERVLAVSPVDRATHQVSSRELDLLAVDHWNRGESVT